MLEHDNMIALFKDAEKRSGVTGVAFGRKSIDSVYVENDPASVVYFVDRKLPKQGGRRTLSNGSRILAKSTVVAGSEYTTDVIGFLDDVIETKVNGGRLQPRRFRAGGPISNVSSVGTFGCLLRKAEDQSLYALTNRHVALGAGTTVYFPAMQPGAVAATTVQDLDLLSDEQFLPFVNHVSAYFDVDAAVVRVPDAQQGSFDLTLPWIGSLTGIYRPDLTGEQAYRTSLSGLSVKAYSWNSKLRVGDISHVNYVTRRPGNQMIVLYSFLVKSSDRRSPGELKDSGKVWVTQSPAGDNMVVGLHQGVIPVNGQLSRYAVATDMFVLSRLMGFEPA